MGGEIPFAAPLRCRILAWQGYLDGGFIGDCEYVSEKWPVCCRLGGVIGSDWEFVHLLV